MSRIIVILMMFVVIAMFYKGIEVLGPSDTNRSVIYEGPNKTTTETWQSAFEWAKKRKDENKSK